jgi:hypothetical protein
MLSAFSADTELSSSVANHLWSGAALIMQILAARSTPWGVPEVETECREQLAALPAYSLVIASAITRMTSSFDAPVTAARAVNKMYLTLFRPLWSEHILERGRLKAASDDIEKSVLKLTTPP